MSSLILFVTVTAQALNAVYQNSAHQEQIVWWMLTALTEKTPPQLICSPEYVTGEIIAALEEMIKKHTQDQVPLHYLLGSVQFGDCDLLIEPPILIPRPETEEWVYNLIARLKALKNKKITILDLCTGSGAIAIALAHALPEATLYATDISAQALLLAQKNSLRNGASLNFIESDLFQELKNLRFDLIVTNPPYISHQEWLGLDPMVRNWEDYTALVAQDDGLALIKKIIEQAPLVLQSNKELLHNNIGQLYIEIGYQQAEAVKMYLQKQFPWVEVLNDYAGNNRVVVGGNKECGIKENT